MIRYSILVAQEVVAERLAQDRRWGEQNHPSAGRGRVFDCGIAAYADSWKQENAAREAGGCLAWDGILLEEVFEALAEGDPKLLRKELIQVAAVAVAWVECLDRRDRGSE